MEGKYLLLARDLGLPAFVIGAVILGVYKIAPALLGVANRQMAERFKERAELLERVRKAEAGEAEWRERYFALEQRRINEAWDRLEAARGDGDADSG